MVNLLEVPRPAVTASDAAQILVTDFNIVGGATELPSERDRNFLIETGTGALVLKVSNSAENPQVIEMENAAMRHIERVDPGLPIPRLVPDRTNSPVSWVTAGDGRRHVVRLITVIPGAHLQGDVMTPELAEQVGAACARTSVALRGFFHPAAGRTHDWDIRHCRDLARHIGSIGDQVRADVVRRALARISPTLDAIELLPAHVQHADVTLTNLLAIDGRLTGVIDFGDIHHTAAACDLAASLTSVLRGVGPIAQVWMIGAAFLRGYQRLRPLEINEGEAISDLVVARLVTTVLISAWRGSAVAENKEYIEQYDDASWDLLIRLMEVRSPGAEFMWSQIAGTSRNSGAGKDLRRRRDEVLGGHLAPLSYRDPLHIVRGEGAWLYDAAGRRYLDGYNNVPVLGHAHPTVNQAIRTQLAMLNVNSRYLHPNVVELAERLVATMPSALDTCIFVNSGTEAVDLAWRMATLFTGNTGAGIVDWSYHGISHAVSDFSSNDWAAEMAPPAHVARFAAPSGSSGDQDGRDAVAGVIEELAAQGHRPGLVMVDPMFTSVGIIDAPAAFMAGLVSAAQASGSLFLADEVQSGFGRTGEQLWRFRLHGIVPDFVTLGKPMGNGYPIGAVITRREIADRFLQRQEYFSTFAASPVAAAAALAVLDVLAVEQLPAQAMRVGDYLRDQVRRLDLAVVHEVRGTGLIAGIELALSRPETEMVVERLKEKRVLVGVTGKLGNVLKVRPPLVWTEEHVDVFVAALNGVLR